MADPAASPTSSRTGLALPLLVLSIAVLAQELLLVRLIAVPLWHHITYMVVTSALLAFGVAGTLLAIKPGLGGKDPRSSTRAFAWHSLLFGATTYVTAQAIGRVSIDTIDLLKEPMLLLRLFGLYLLVGLPLLFAGLAVTTALRTGGDGVARLYFVNLVGSGLGCVAFLLLLAPLGGPSLLLFTALLGIVAGVHAAFQVKARLTLGVGLVLLALTASGVVIPSLRDRLVPEGVPVASKEIHRYMREGHRRELTLWNALCRIDVTDLPGPRTTPLEKARAKMIFQDGDAPTYLYPTEAPVAMETMVPYLMHPSAKSILVIGAGGGRELSLAAKQNLDRIVGVEINSATVSLLRDHYKDFTGNILGNPKIELVNAEARSYLSRHKERFDFIQMTGVDTYAALNSGAYVASESYLYTNEAFDTYLSHLNPGGYFSIIRLFFAEAERETLRLFVMAMQALERLGVKDPRSHLLVVNTGSWGILVVGRSPIPTERVGEIRSTVLAQAKAQEGTALALHYDPEQKLKTPFTAYADAHVASEEARERFFSTYPFNVRPVDDDSPFFYLYHHWGLVLKRVLGMKTKGVEGQTSADQANPWLANTGEVPTGQYVLLGLLGQAVLVGFLLVLGPLWAFRRRALAIPGRTRTIVYFGCLGLGFMLLEIGLAQKFSLFLGHPTLSLSVVLGGMLVFSGLGAFVSGKFPARVTSLATLVVAALAFALVFILPKITQTWLEAAEGTRILMALLVLLPLSFFMGMPMPSGLRLLSQHGSDLVPWAFGTNGVASVVGSILAIVLAMEVGFTGVLIISGGLYLLAAATRLRTKSA